MEGEIKARISEYKTSNTLARSASGGVFGKREKVVKDVKKLNQRRYNSPSTRERAIKNIQESIIQSNRKIKKILHTSPAFPTHFHSKSRKYSYYDYY